MGSSVAMTTVLSLSSLLTANLEERLTATNGRIQSKVKTISDTNTGEVATFNGEENIPEKAGLGLQIDLKKMGWRKNIIGFLFRWGGINTAHPCDQIRKEKPGNDWK